MSASNWAICPRCQDNELTRVAALRAAADAAYGTVPEDEYRSMRAESERPIDVEQFRTFREDWEIYGAATGALKVSYGGWCEKCNLGLDYTDKKHFYTPVNALMEDEGM